MGKRNDEYANYVADLLAPLGPIHWRAMFGGYGVYCGDLFFALVIDDVLYLKADNESRGLFEAEGLQPFTYAKDGKTATIRYYQAPDLLFDDEDALREWGNIALAAALRARKPEKKVTVKAAAVKKASTPVKKTPVKKAAVPKTAAVAKKGNSTGKAAGQKKGRIEKA